MTGLLLPVWLGWSVTAFLSHAESTEVMHHWSVALCWHSLLQSSSFHTTATHNDGHVFTAALKHIELLPYTYLCVSSVHVYY